MAVNSDYKVTWADYFTMDSKTYNLKKEIVEFVNNYFKSDGRFSVADHYLCKGANVAILEMMARSNPTLSNDNVTVPLLFDLHKKINEIYNQIIIGESKGVQFSFSENNVSWDSSENSTSLITITDDLTWPGGIHIPFDIHPNIPEGSSSTPNVYDAHAGGSYEGYSADSW